MEIGLTRERPVEWKLWNSAIRFPKPQQGKRVVDSPPAESAER